MQNVQSMKAAEPVQDLDDHIPDFFFFKELLFLFVVNNFLVKIAIV